MLKGQTRESSLLDKCFINVERAHTSGKRRPIANLDLNVAHLVLTYKTKLKSS